MSNSIINGKVEIREGINTYFHHEISEVSA